MGKKEILHMLTSIITNEKQHFKSIDIWSMTGLYFLSDQTGLYFFMINRLKIFNGSGLILFYERCMGNKKLLTSIHNNE